MMVNWDELSYEEAREIKEALEAMLDSPGWEFTRQFIASRTSIRAAELINYRIESVEQIARYNRLQGELEEIARFPDVIAHYLSDLTSEVRKLQDEAQAELDL